MTSNLTALLAARERALPGARATGVGGRARRRLLLRRGAPLGRARGRDLRARQRARCAGSRSTTQRRMRADALAEALARDVAAGVVPVAVVATAGTTLTGAVDPLDAIADVCARARRLAARRRRLRAARRGRRASAAPLFAGLERADSATLDAHKWLGVQKSCSVVLLREPGQLRGRVRPRGALHAPRGRHRQPGRPHARVLAPAALAAAVDGVPRPRRRRSTAPGSSGRWPTRAGWPSSSRAAATSSCCTSRCSRPSASATSPAGVGDLDAHNVAARARDAARRARSSSRPPRSTAARACARASSTSAPRPTRSPLVLEVAAELA